MANHVCLTAKSFKCFYFIEQFWRFQLCTERRTDHFVYNCTQKETGAPGDKWQNFFFFKYFFSPFQNNIFSNSWVLHHVKFPILNSSCVFSPSSIYKMRVCVNKQNLQDLGALLEAHHYFTVCTHKYHHLQSQSSCHTFFFQSHMVGGGGVSPHIQGYRKTFILFCAELQQQQERKRTSDSHSKRDSLFVLHTRNWTEQIDRYS